MLKRLSIRTCVALLLATGLFAGCASAPKFDDSLCTPYVGCPTSYNAPNDSFPYVRNYEALKAMSLQQKLDYIGSIHKALLNPDAYHTHRANLLWNGEAPAVLAMAESDGVFPALATMTITFGRQHRGEPFIDDVPAVAQHDPALVAAIQSSVPVVSGYDAVQPQSRDQYVMVYTFNRLYQMVPESALKGDPRSCELVATANPDAIEVRVSRAQDLLRPDHHKIDDINAACAQVPSAAQALYQHRVFLRSIWASAHRDEARIDQHKQAWVSKALALEATCRRVGVDPNRISYDAYSMQKMARDIAPGWDDTYKDGTNESAYRELVAEHVYLVKESNLFLNGAAVTPLLTPYTFISAVGRTCG